LKLHRLWAHSPAARPRGAGETHYGRGQRAGRFKGKLLQITGVPATMEPHMSTNDPRTAFSKPAAEDIAELDLHEPRHVKVVMHNDNYTTMEFVIQVLLEVFRKTPPQAQQIMLRIHERGQGDCGVYPLEVAETKVAVVHARARALGFPLRCSLEYV